MTRDERLPDRFWNKVTENEDTGCWEWTAAKMPNGYSRFMCPVRMRTWLAHRVAFEHLVGPIPEGLDLDHLCRNRGCVNPAHLEPVTRRENLRRGETNMAKAHCSKGHPYSDENTYRWKNRRYCRTCASSPERRAYIKAWQARAQAAAQARVAA